MAKKNNSTQNNINEQKKKEQQHTHDLQELINSDQDDFNYQQMKHNNE